MANPTSKKLVVSNGVQYYGTGLKNIQKSLSTRYLENSIVVSMHSPLPENMQTSGSKYDYKSGIEIYLKAKTAKSLAKLCKKARAAIAEGSDFEPMGVSSGANLIEVSDGTQFNLKPAITLTIYGDISSDKKTDTYDVFQFANDKYIIGYDRSQGTYNEAFIDTDIECFIEQLNTFTNAATNAVAHCIKKEFAFDLNRYSARQLQVMDKLGIQSDYKFNAGQSWVQRQASQVNNTSGGGTASMSADDLMAELDNM